MYHTIIMAILIQFVIAEHHLNAYSLTKRDVQLKDGKYSMTIDEVKKLAALSQTFREDLECLGNNTENAIALLELSLNDFQVILEMINTQNNGQLLTNLIERNYPSFNELYQLYEYLRFLDIKPLREFIKWRINKKLSLASNATLKTIDPKGKELWFINAINARIQPALRAQLNNKQSEFEPTQDQLQTILTILANTHVDEYVSKLSFDDLLDTLAAALFLKTEEVQILLEAKLAERIQKAKPSYHEILFNRIKETIPHSTSFKTINLFVNNFKADMYNFVLKDGLIVKSVTEQDTIQKLVEASVLLTNYFEETKDTYMPVFYLNHISKKSFDLIYNLIKELPFSDRLCKELQKFPLLPLSLILKAANYLEIPTLINATKNQLAKKLIEPDALNHFKNGRLWSIFLGLEHNLDHTVATVLSHQAKLSGQLYLCKTLMGHKKEVTSVAWNPQKNILASGSSDERVKIWNSENGNLMNTFKPDLFDAFKLENEKIMSVAWSPNGKMIAAALNNQKVKIWDIESNTLVQTLTGCHGEVMSVAWNPQETLLAASSHYGILKVWNTKNWQLSHTIYSNSRPMATIDWSTDGTQLASGSHDGQIHIWSSSNGKKQSTLSDPKGYITSIAWHYKGTQLATASQDKTIKIWDTENNISLQKLKGHLETVSSLAWNPTNTILASGSYDKTIKTWDTATWLCLHTVPAHDSPVKSISWSSNGNLLASGSKDTMIKIWRVIHDDDLANLTTDQTLLVALAQEKYRNNEKVYIDKKLREIYATLPTTSKELLHKKYAVNVLDA